MRLIPFVLSIFLLAPLVCAQSTTGTLVGTVRDASGLPMPGVSVVATEVATNFARNAETNDSGLYSIPGLNPGAYRLEFQKAQFKKAFAEVELSANETRRVNIPMTIGQITETVEVRSEISLLQTDTSSISAVVDQGRVQRLPSNGRLIESFIQLLTGAAPAAPNSQLSSRGGFNVNGFDEHYQSYFVDGIDNSDPVIRNFSYRPVLDGVFELRIEQSAYSAEFGRNAGAVVNVITKSGTNDWRGSFWEFFRNDNLDARDFFAIAGVEKPSLIRNQYGLSLGGPLKRDRTFFFGWYEGLRQKTGQVRRASVPTALMRSGDFSEFFGPTIPASQIHPLALDILQGVPLPNRPGIALNRIEVANRIENEDNYSGRLDHQWTAGTRLMGRFSSSRADVIDPFRTETGGGSNLSTFGQSADRFRTNLGITLTTVAGQNLVHEFRAGYSRFRQPLKPLNPGTPAQQPLMGFVKAFPSFSIPPFDGIGSSLEFTRVSNVYDYIDNIFYARGNHQFKFGVDARRYLFNGRSVPANIFMFFGARTGLPIRDFLQGLPHVVVSFEGSPGGNTRKFEFAGYAQDDWKIRSNFTINYGVRWEYYGRMTERTNKQSFWVPECNCIRHAGIEASEGLVDNDFNNFAPRLGFAWRPRERLVVRASSGIFYDNDMRHNTEVFSNPPFFFTREFIFPGSAPSFDNPFPSGSVSPDRPNTYDQHYRDTYAEHWNLNVQYEVAKDIVAGVSYVGNHTVKARRVRNLNQPLIPGTTTLPNPDFATITLYEQAGSSNYNALQVQVERRFSRGLGFLSSYTWGHAIDDRPGQGLGQSQDAYNMSAERASSDFDVRHTWVVSGTYNMPFGAGKPWGNWSVNAISTARSGRPFTVNVPGNIPNLRPNAVPGVDWRPADQGADEWINSGAFTAPASNTYGTVGRNTLTGPGLYNLDVSVVKVHRIGERYDLQFRAEFFNILNHPNFGMPNNAYGPSLGTIASTASPGRQIQFGIKLGF